ncbi:MAG: nitrous oxide reductase accessory protein NosL [Balneolaceae bacterium]|nr:nitrous oxide reductase accessory protein NosL [Balneolaceae bacterium]
MKNFIALILPGLILLSACLSQEPSEIQLHTDECTYCKMVISDTQFAAQLVSDKGKAYKFDSIECMAAFTHQNPEIAENAKLYLSDYTQNKSWMLLENASVYHSEDVQSPMGLSLFAIPSDTTLPGPLSGAEQQEWDQTVDFVLNQWNGQQ